MKLAVGSARRHADDVQWFRRHAPAMPLAEIVERLRAGKPIFDWSPDGEPLDLDVDAPFRRIAEIRADAHASGIELAFYEIDSSESADDPRDGWVDPLDQEHAQNVIDSWQLIRRQQR